MLNVAYSPPQHARIASHLFGMNAMRLRWDFAEYCSTLEKVWYPRLWQEQEALILHQYVIQMCRKYAQSDWDQDSTLCIPYALLIQLQESAPQFELYEVWHYPALKEMNYQQRQHKVQHQVSGSRLWSHPSAISNNIQICTSANTDSETYHHTNLSVKWSFLNEYSVILSASFLSYQNMRGVKLWTESELNREQRLIPIHLYLT